MATKKKAVLKAATNDVPAMTTITFNINASRSTKTTPTISEFTTDFNTSAKTTILTDDTSFDSFRPYVPNAYGRPFYMIGKNKGTVTTLGTLIINTSYVEDLVIKNDFKIVVANGFTINNNTGKVASDVPGFTLTMKGYRNNEVIFTTSATIAALTRDTLTADIPTYTLSGNCSQSPTKIEFIANITGSRFNWLSTTISYDSMPATPNRYVHSSYGSYSYFTHPDVPDASSYKLTSAMKNNISNYYSGVTCLKIATSGQKNALGIDYANTYWGNDRTNCADSPYFKINGTPIKFLLNKNYCKLPERNVVDYSNNNKPFKVAYDFCVKDRPSEDNSIAEYTSHIKVMYDSSSDSCKIWKCIMESEYTWNINWTYVGEIPGPGIFWIMTGGGGGLNSLSRKGSGGGGGGATYGAYTDLRAMQESLYDASGRTAKYLEFYIGRGGVGIGNRTAENSLLYVHFTNDAPNTEGYTSYRAVAIIVPGGGDGWDGHGGTGGNITNAYHNTDFEKYCCRFVWFNGKNGGVKGQNGGNFVDTYSVGTNLPISPDYLPKEYGHYEYIWDYKSWGCGGLANDDYGGGGATFLSATDSDIGYGACSAGYGMGATGTPYSTRAVDTGHGANGALQILSTIEY